MKPQNVQFEENTEQKIGKELAVLEQELKKIEEENSPDVVGKLVS